MNDPRQADAMKALLDPAMQALPAFPVTSRYYAIETTVHVDAHGKETRHLRRRFLPLPETLQQVDSHLVAQGDRLDRIAAIHLGDPLQFWRICDGNGAMQPDDLTARIGRRLRITLPAGIAGPVL
jgi:hypothetical protein